MKKGAKHKLNYRGTPVERFWAKVNKTDSCWLWTGATKDKGYGLLRVGGKNIGAHVFSYQLHTGFQVLKGTFVCHNCDNPPCVNPLHLWLGDNTANVNDMVIKKRHTFGERNGQAKLTEEIVLKMQKLKQQGVSQEAMTKIFEVSRTCISQTLNGKRWKHLWK